MKKFEYIRALLIDINYIFDVKKIQNFEFKKSKSFGDIKDNSKHSLSNMRIYLKNIKKIAHIMFIAAKNKQKIKLKLAESIESDSDELFIQKPKKEDFKEQDKKLMIEKQKQKLELQKKFNVF